MTEKIKTWLVNETGTYALVEGADARDQLLPLGWAEAGEPPSDAFVWFRHPEVTVPARMPAGTFAEFTARGWEPGPPPTPQSQFNGDAAIAPTAVEPPPEPDKPKKPAAGGDSKEN